MNGGVTTGDAVSEFLERHAEALKNDPEFVLDCMLWLAKLGPDDVTQGAHAYIKRLVSELRAGHCLQDGLDEARRERDAAC